MIRDNLNFNKKQIQQKIKYKTKYLEQDELEGDVNKQEIENVVGILEKKLTQMQ